MFPPKIWREIPQRYRLEANQCINCGKIFFPPRLICDKCKNKKFKSIKLDNIGKIVSYTKIYTSPPGFEDEVPYYLGIIELENKVRITCQIVDIISEEKIKIGEKVKLEFRKIQEDGKKGVICYGYKAVILGEHNQVK